MIQIYLSRMHKEKVYETMLDRIDCGPFDGGCVSFALALQRVLGGEVQVITGNLLWDPSQKQWSKGAQHAVLKMPDGRLIDAGGAGHPDGVVERFIQTEITPPAIFQYTGLRDLRDGDLPDAPRDDALISQLAALLSHLQAEAARTRPVAPWDDTRTAPNGLPVRDNFAAWFGSSKAVGHDGAPLVLYRGTTRDESTLGTPAYFADDPRETKGYARGDGGHVLPVYLRILNPLEMEGEDYWKVIRKGEAAEKKLAAQARKKGHDGIIVRRMQDTAAHFTMFITVQGPEQVKSAIGNSGNYESTNPCIADATPAPTPKQAPTGLAP